MIELETCDFYFFSMLLRSLTLDEQHHERCSKRSKVGASHPKMDVMWLRAKHGWAGMEEREREAARSDNVKMVKIYDFLWKSLRPNIMGNAREPPHSSQLSHIDDDDEKKNYSRRNEWTQFSPKTFNQAWNILQNLKLRKKIYKL